MDVVQKSEDDLDSTSVPSSYRANIWVTEGRVETYDFDDVDSFPEVQRWCRARGAEVGALAVIIYAKTAGGKNQINGRPNNYMMRVSEPPPQGMG